MEVGNQSAQAITPEGQYCYRIEPHEANESLPDVDDRFGQRIRVARYQEGYKIICCPYWQTTDYGTVRCLFLDQEFIDSQDGEALEKVQSRFLLTESVNWFDINLSLDDKMKICGVNME